jgi:hypothetical protein
MTSSLTNSLTRANGTDKSASSMLENSLLPGEARGGQFFCFIQAFNELGEAHPHNGGQSLYAKFTNLNANLIQKHSPK